MFLQELKQHFLSACIASVLFHVSFTPTIAEGVQAPDLKAVAKRGSETLARLEKETATWTTTFELPKPGIAFQIVTYQSPNARAFEFAVEQNGVVHDVARIIERENAWYVFQQDSIEKYRPYEAPLAVPSLYEFMGRSELKCIIEDTLSPVGQLESLSGKIATYRVPLPERAKNLLQNSLAAFEQAKRQSPEQVDRKFEQQIPSLIEAIEHGVTMDLVIETGIIAAAGGVGKRYWVRDFRWLPESENPASNVDLKVTADRSSSILEHADAIDDIFMIGHAAAWKPGAPALDTDRVLINRRTGKMRRVPFPLGIVASGCFSKDRQSVFVSGQIPDEGSLGLFELHLETGALRRLGENALGQFCLFPTLSPDGRTLAILSKGGEELGMLDSQIFLVDVMTGNARTLGKALDTAFLSWLPDGTGLVLITRKYESLDQPAEETIAKINLQGHITPLRPGSFPIVLRPQERILYLDEEDKLWKTCDFSGTEVELVSDGLKGFSFPAVSPDGQFAIMMRFDRSTGPRPHLINLSNGETTPIPVGQGLWIMPAWQ